MSKTNNILSLRVTFFVALFVLFASYVSLGWVPQFQYEVKCNESNGRHYQDTVKMSYPVRHNLDDCSTLLECLQRCDFLDGRNLFPKVSDAKYLVPLLDNQGAIDPQTVVLAFDEHTDHIVNRAQQEQNETSPVNNNKSYTVCRSAPIDTSIREFEIGLVIVSASEENVALQQSILDKMQYAEAWGYGFHKFGRLVEKRNPHWSKVPAVLSVLHLYDFVWWVDIDSVIMDHNIPLESIIDPRYDLIFTNDFNGLNSGSFFVRNTDWSRGFFANVWTRINNTFIWPGEQGAILEALGDPYLRNHCKMIHNHWMNDFHFLVEEGKVTDLDFFLLHFPGISPDRKSELIKAYMQERKLKIPEN